MKDYQILLADGGEITVAVKASLPQHRAVWVAMDKARKKGHVPFSARPVGCTGSAHNVHFGRFCPIHPEA
jgi:hypothetical protein